MKFETIKFQCYYCRDKLTDRNRTKDHIIPKSKGGLLSNGNKVFACLVCNKWKGNLTLEEWLEEVKSLKLTPKTEYRWCKRMFIIQTLYPMIELLKHKENGKIN